MIISEEDMREAIDRIARTHDGQLLYRYFQQSLSGVPTNANDSALREHNGRRSFAAELMGLMAKGIEESGGTDASKRPIVFTRKQPDAGGRHVTARDYFRNQQSEPAAGTE